MRVLVACEESQRVCSAFRELGHEAYSCDIQEPSGGHPEWHILGDVLPILQGGRFETMDGTIHFIEKWDLLIAHPPCTYISNAGVRFLYPGGKGILNEERLRKGIEATHFFLRFLYAPIDKIAVENPEERQSSKIAGNWFNAGGKDRQRNRAKTFPGIAKAMAEQWGGDIR